MLYYDVELPLITVLASMQINGFLVDENELRRFGEYLSGKIDAAVIRTAIEKYCASSGDRLEFLAGENPVTFRLNGKETYIARVCLGHSRLNRGYYIKCQQIAEESGMV